MDESLKDFYKQRRLEKGYIKMEEVLEIILQYFFFLFQFELLLYTILGNLFVIVGNSENTDVYVLGFFEESLGPASNGEYHDSI